MPANWEAYRWQARGEKETGYVELQGGVFRKKITRGKNKGRTDYRSPEPGTAATLSLSNKAHAEWLKLWEAETGHCVECMGTGKAWAGWNYKHGSCFRPCKECGATGTNAAAGSNVPTDKSEAPAK
jgi:hypothetical protein